MIRQIRYWRRLVRWYFVSRSKQIASAFAVHRVPLSFIDRTAAGIVVKGTTLSVDSDNCQLIASSWQVLAALIHAYSPVFSNSEPGRLTIQIDEISLSISTFEEIVILGEVFGKRIYDLHSANNVHVVDIGANIGIATLFFASRPWVSQVTAFELLWPTLEVARRNLELNPHLSPKVELRDYGLAANDRQVTLQYSPTWKGSIGITTAPTFVVNAPDLRIETATLRRASEAFKELIAQGSQPIIVKMDCEGAEYEILEDLADSGVLKEIAALIIEWHDRGPAPLADLLLMNGYWIWTSRVEGTRDLGLLYAVAFVDPS